MMKKIPPPNLKVLDTAIRYVKKGQSPFSALESALETHYKWPSDDLIFLYFDQYCDTVSWHLDKNPEYFDSESLEAEDITKMETFRDECYLSGVLGPIQESPDFL
jgi:hypothetical protein